MFENQSINSITTENGCILHAKKRQKFEKYHQVRKGEKPNYIIAKFKNDEQIKEFV